MVREIDGDPTETTVAEHYDDPDLELAVTRGSFIAPAPPGYEGADHLEYEQGDRIRQEDVTLDEFATANNLVLLGGRSTAPRYGASLDALDRNEEECVREFGSRSNHKDNFHPEEHTETETDAGDAGDVERGENGQFAAEGD